MFLLAQQSVKDSLITNYLQKIASIQATAGNKFPMGIIPSFRQYALNNVEVKADDNIFFSALVVYTLQSYKHALNDEQKLLVDSITERVKRAAHFYKNAKGRNTYCFWRTNPTVVFPNSGWINLFDKVNALPDDFDDTVMMLLALQTDSSSAAIVHSIMQEFTNGSKKNIQNTFDEYKNIPAYSTWFGVKFPIDFDISVLSNVLLFVQKNNLQWTKADSACLQLITQIVQKKQHVTHPQYVSPHYAKTSIILYHISRLMEVKPIQALEQLKPQLIEEAILLFQKSDNIIEKTLLSTALIRWKKSASTLIVIKNDVEIPSNNFSFFIANMASMAANPYKEMIGKMGVGKFYYYCAAYNYALVIENLLLHQ